MFYGDILFLIVSVACSLLILTSISRSIVKYTLEFMRLCFLISFTTDIQARMKEG